MEDISVLGVFRELVVDELCLNSLLRGHDENGLRGASGETAHKIIQLAALREHARLHESVGTESDVVLGDGEEEEGAISTIETEDAALTPSLLDRAHHT